MAVTEVHSIAPSKVWTVLLTTAAYLPGVLTLAHSLRLVGSAYPLIVLYTDSLPATALAALKTRGIQTIKITYIHPANAPTYAQDPRFRDCWTKLIVFSLTQFTRIVQLDADMLVRQNMDELMDLPLDTGAGAGAQPAMAAGHACVCNPLRKPHYPRDWTPANCAFTTQHASADAAQERAPARDESKLRYLNGGLQVLEPSAARWAQIEQHMQTHAADMPFADQSVLSDVFEDCWVPLPYVYNALKTMRWEGVHDAIWRDERVKNMHYLLSPKPWDDEVDENGKCLNRDPTHQWWVDTDHLRRAWERKNGILDGL
ncbi:hypothetical protein BROUX41_001541 [Berkeleyomyces rouxiae]|uniref:uncharacterized protein n=1 Tax=Berkeleyomyces rouxiae TaxID=2035830 RepID=UPI003B7EC03C